MEIPYISVVIPVFNGERTIGSCLESIIRSKYPNTQFEIIIVDNGSTDKTINIIEDFKSSNNHIKLYTEKIKNAYRARNLGIQKANGKIIVFTDADCIVNKDWLMNLAKGFSEPSIGGVSGDILPVFGNSIIERYSIMMELISPKVTLNSGFLPYPPTANVAYRKELFDKIGYFDTKMISGGDADFAWRMQLETNYKILYIEDAIVFHKHRTNLRDLMRQQFKYGYGAVLLHNKYKNFYHLKQKKKKNKISKIIYHVKRMKLYDLLFNSLLYMISYCGYFLGKIHGSIEIKKQG